MIVVLLGPPGAGKGTQAVKLAQRFGLVHLSSGDILRAERTAKTELGQKAQTYMDRGALVPDDLILSMMQNRITSKDATKGCLLDGFPRTLAQAEELDRRLQKDGRKIDVVVNIVVDDAEVTRRLTGRWSCPKDGRIYHEVFSPPANKGVCDDCSTPLTRRKDDEPQVVSQRLVTYHDQTKPVIAYYQGLSVLKAVPGEGAVDMVASDIEKACRV